MGRGYCQPKERTDILMSNITLSNSLDNLLKNKSNLNHIEVDQRKAAIETHEPLVIANVPVTTGRLAVLLNRIDYMTESDVEYNSILVILPNEAEVENFMATRRFAGSMTVKQIVSKINGAYPIPYKNIIIDSTNAMREEDMSAIIQFISENGQSLFIAGNAEESTVMKTLIDSDVFTVYNL